MSFCFQTVDEKETKNFTSWHEDIAMFGRHYLVCSTSQPAIRRHYTICNALVPEFYDEVIKITQNIINEEETDFNSKLLNSRS